MLLAPVVHQRVGWSAVEAEHRAAIGLSELTDAVVLVVSEERGSMRIALGGRLGPDLNGTELREQLQAEAPTEGGRADPPAAG